MLTRAVPMLAGYQSLNAYDAVSVLILMLLFAFGGVAGSVTSFLPCQSEVLPVLNQ